MKEGNIFSHRDLCLKASKYLRNNGIHPFHRCQYVVCELERTGECPDAFGFGGSTTQLIEVKVSRSDFLSDKKKYWRKYPENGIGRFRSYLCPEGLIKQSDLPEYWGLLWVDDKGEINKVVDAEAQTCNHIEEINVITSILRRENISPKIFSYKKYNKMNNKELISDNNTVSTYKDPYDWFCEKYDVDILGERLRIIEHSAKDVIYFISEYMKDNFSSINHEKL